MAKKKAQVEENPLYKQICDNSKNCTVESKIVDLEDMILKVCPQCYNKRSWCKKEIEKPEKKAKKEKAVAVAMPLVGQVQAVPTVQQDPGPSQVLTQAADQIVTALPPMQTMPQLITPGAQLPPVNVLDEEIKRNAEQTQKMFESVDSMVENISKIPDLEIPVVPVIPPIQVAPPIPAPIAVGVANAPVPAQVASVPLNPIPVGPVIDSFIIESCQIKSSTEVALICETTMKKRFVVKATSDPEKVQMLAANPNLVRGLYAKIEFDQYGAEGVPSNPKYLTMHPKQ
jgi:hypothetical protein